ncbi:hypothetical protein BUALT_Bualt05G0005400 [Buddleja alternifolia]|uniref:Pentatricopeptide repeat-containing protein n=1 Tax=Buddleja alternifolia TaxID=168488 RepID=A0AAV6XNE0_9LAMI|nr:hypothetical protein BUALT_Bualt05G0005400 [Buddleja alternifolia]
MSKILNLSKVLNRTDQKLPLLSHIQSRYISANSVLVPTHQHIAHLILDQKSANQAVQTFEWASKIPNFKHTQSTYRALIHKLCTFRQFNVVEQVLDEMPKRIGSSPDDDIFITIVRGFGRAKMTREAIRVLNLVSKFGDNAPSLKVLNTILDVLVKEDIDIAREFYRKKMMGNGVKGDDYTYGILMKGFCLTNRIGDGFKLLQVMKTHGVKVNIVVYNTLIYALCKNGKVGRARSLMSEMVEFSDVTFNIMISSYCDENNPVQAMVMMEKCFGSGFLPDIVALTKVVEILCNAGRIAEAVEVLERVEEKGGILDVVAYNTLLKGFVKGGKVKAGCGYLKQMEMKGCLPNTETYNVVITGLCESRMLDSALDMFDEMKRVGVERNFVTFATLIYGLCSGGRTRDGLMIFELMGEGKGGFEGHIGPYNSILYGLYKENRMDKALEFLNYMKNLFPRAVDRSLSILTLCQEGNIEKAKKILDKMNDEGDFPNALVYASLIQGFCKNGCMKEAVELMNEMIGHNFFPVASTFNVLINGFCGQGKVKTALRLLEDLKMRSCLPDYESYGLLIKAFCSEGDDIQQVLMLFMEMVERGISPDYCSWNALILVALEGPLAHYKSLVNQGKLQDDPYQEKVAFELDNLLGRLDQYEKDMEEYHANLAKWEESREKERRRLLMEEAEAKQHGGESVNKRRNFFQKLMSSTRSENVEPGVGKWVSYLNRERKLDSLVGRRPTAPTAPKGLYLYGNVGSVRRKELLSIEEGFTFTRQVLAPTSHCVLAMLQINYLMHEVWKKQKMEKSPQSSISNWVMNLPFDTKIKEWLVEEERYKQEMKMKNILPAVADKFLVDGQGDRRGASVLCFDEIQTVDVFAIIALSGIVSRLLSTGTVLVATSNRAPRDLNQTRYFWPLDSTKMKRYENTWKKVVEQSGGKVTSQTLWVMFGRTLEVSESCNGAARFTFEYLCGRPVGAADYIAVAKTYHTVFISDIPVMSMRIRDKARRFITLVDELYNHHCCLYCSAAASIDDLFQETEGTKLRRDVLAEGKVSSSGPTTGIISLLSGQEEMFAFQRAVSRLIEMQTPLYLEGVRHIHPYFHANQTGHEIDIANVVPS